jgi:hypothetical protein
VVEAQSGKRSLAAVLPSDNPGALVRHFLNPSWAAESIKRQVESAIQFLNEHEQQTVELVLPVGAPADFRGNVRRLIEAAHINDGRLRLTENLSGFHMENGQVVLDLPGLHESSGKFLDEGFTSVQFLVASGVLVKGTLNAEELRTISVLIVNELLNAMAINVADFENTLQAINRVLQSA